MRSGLTLILVVVTIALTALAHASPPDPTWVSGLWNGTDFDEVVITATSATAVAVLHGSDR
jgi:hypothetical protein